MDGRRRITELAGLLDGEIKDIRRVEELNKLVAADPGLKAEFEVQRAVKTALNRMSEEEAPAYMDTRVIGEIAARRGLTRSYRLRTWGAAVGGFMLCLLVVGTFMHWRQPVSPSMTGEIMADRLAEPLVPAGLMRDTTEFYCAQDWRDIRVPMEDTDPQVADFLEFVRDAHGYKVMVYTADSVSPDLPAAILVVDEGGNW